MVKLNKIIKTLGIILAAILVCETAFAGTAGDRGGMSGNECANIEGGGTTGGKCTVVWYRYQYTDNKKENTPTIIPYAKNRGGAKWGDRLYIGVSGDASTGNDGCFGKSKSFYAKGAALGYTSGTKVSTIYKSQQFGSATATYDSVYGAGKDVNGNDKISSLGKHGTEPEGSVLNYSYAFSEEYSISPSRSYKDENDNEIRLYHYLGYLYKDNVDITNGNLYIDKHSNQPGAVAQGHIVTTEEAKKAFCVAAGKAEDCAAGADVTVDGYSFEGDTKPASWFCAYDSVKKEGFTKGTTSILARDSKGNELVKAVVSEAGESKTKSEEVTIRSLPSPTITIVSDFKGERDLNRDNQVDTKNGYTLETNPKWSSYYWANNSDESGRFDEGALTANNVTKSVSKKVDLQPGETVEFCSSLTYDHHYKKEGETVTWLPKEDTNYDQKACIKLKYEPSVAEIDSVTTLDLGSKKITSGKDENAEYSLGEVDYGAKAIVAKWSYELSSSKRCFEGDFKDYACSSNEDSIKSDFTVKYKRSGVVYNDSNYDDQFVTLRNSKYSSSVGTITKTYGLFPGEQLTQKQGISHYSGVHTDGTPAESAKEESSSVAFDATAKDIECRFNNGDYDIKYSIGVNNPNDYRWLQIRNNNSITKTVGDGIPLQNDEFWLKPESQIQITQTACFGSQIKQDAENKNGNRWTKNPWKEITDYSNNKLFELSSDLKSSIGSSLFDNATGASKTKSNVNASLTASEIGISNFSKVSNPSTRVANGYRIETSSNPNMVTIGNLGKSLNTSFSKPNRESVSITTKIPYNYYMSLDLEGDGSKGYLTSESTTFKVNITNEGRINKQVCNDTSECDAYPTMSKKTTAGMLVFTISSEFKVTDLEGKDSFSYNGNIFDSANDSLLEYRMVEAVKNHFPYGDSIEVIDRNHLKYITDRVFNKEEELPIMSDSLDLSDLAVGTKVCAVAAVYPSDSHDTGNGDSINDPVQSAAFSPTGTKTGLKVSCRTVAKHQNMSVEGNGVVTTQTIYSSNTTHNATNGKKIFRSWSEYQIISGGSNASSGAVTAYALNNSIIMDKNVPASLDNSSVLSGSYLYPQTLGNYSLATIGGKKSDPNSGDESEVNWRYSETLIKNIVDTYGTKDGECKDGELPTSKNYLKCINGDVLLRPVYQEGIDTLVVRSTGTLTIDNESYLNDLSQWGNPKQLIIIARSISIAGDVTSVNAWLIVDGGELNTCSEHYIGKEKGNEDLLMDCNDQLIVNGPVIVRGGVPETALKLLRTFGGGSKVNEYGEFVKDPNTLVQRAEIFNYDPSVVEWAYRESQKNPHLETTYTETLAPRL